MGRHNRAAVWAALALLPGPLFFGRLVHSQQHAENSSMRITTQERLDTEAWWPTMATAPLQDYAGSAACGRCHGGKLSPTPTGMQQAATRAADSHFIPAAALTSFVTGSRTYSLQAKDAALEYSVASGGQAFAENLDWVFGAGDLGRTFLYKDSGQWFQSETSFYTQPAAMDITTGFGPSTSPTLKGALGNVLSPAEARACFNCHTSHAVTSAGLAPEHSEPGVGCESCHGPGLKHVQAMTAVLNGGVLKEVSMFDPRALSPADSVDFCGSCHRSFADASLSTGPSVDRAVVRFQPYRLEESKCWRATQDRRLTCVACHDPHKPLVRDASSYDGDCVQCHSRVAQTHPAVQTPQTPVARVCPKATHDCVTCHMPKVNLPSVHGEFTDHFIRIAKAGDPLPR